MTPHESERTERLYPYNNFRTPPQDEAVGFIVYNHDVLAVQSPPVLHKGVALVPVGRVWVVSSGVSFTRLMSIFSSSSKSGIRPFCFFIVDDFRTQYLAQ